MVTPARSRPARALAALLAGGLLVAACGADDEDGAGPGAEHAPPAAAPGDDGRTGANPAGCVDGAEDGEDLFPDRFTIEHAENLSLAYEGTYKVMTVAEPYPGAGEQAYVLAQCGTEPPPLEGDLAGATVVEVPVDSLFSQSQSHLGFLDALGAADVVTGVSDGEAVVMPSVRARVDAGGVTSFAAGGVADAEQVIAAAPDVLVTGGTEDPAYEAIAGAGIPVLANAEWLEASPQGWAEWIAFFAALTNTEARATEAYDALLARYDEAAARADGVEDRPSVLTGGLYEGDWHARGGGGTVGRFIADAGGDYVYADEPSTGTLTLDIEAVLADARDAEVWLSPSAGFTSRAEAEAADERYGQFAAWDAGGVWEADVAQRAGIDIFESGPVMIDEYLLDYVKVLHPELAEDHDLVFFRRLPDG